MPRVLGRTTAAVLALLLLTGCTAAKPNSTSAAALPGPTSSSEPDGKTAATGSAAPQDGPKLPDAAPPTTYPPASPVEKAANPASSACQSTPLSDDSKRAARTLELATEVGRLLATSTPSLAAQALGPCFTATSLAGSATPIVVFADPGNEVLAVQGQAGWATFPLVRVPTPGEKAMPVFLAPVRGFDTPTGLRILGRSQLPGSGGYGSMELWKPGTTLEVVSAFGRNSARVLDDGQYIFSIERVQDPIDFYYSNASTPAWLQVLYQWNGQNYVETARRFTPSPKRTVTWFVGHLANGNLKEARTLTTSDDVMNQVLKVLPTRKQDIPALVLPQPQLPKWVDDEGGYWEALPEDLGGPKPPATGKVVWPFGKEHQLTVERINGEWLVTGFEPRN